MVEGIIENKRKPADWEEYPESIISNFDHIIHEEIAEVLKNNNFWSHYPGWGFSGQVWYQDEMWNCEIWQYHNYVHTICSSTIGDMKRLVCEFHGDE